MTRQFTTFYLGEGLFGVDVLVVREINRSPEITYVNRGPEFLAGLMNLRGQIVSVVDLPRRLGIRREKADAGSQRCIVLKTNQEMDQDRQRTGILDKTSNDIVGLLVDKIGDMVTIEGSDIETAPANVADVDGKYLHGVVKLERELLSILRPQAVLSMDEADR